jgi:hypothetical protein
MKSRINWVAIIVAAVVYMILGMGWYMAWGDTWLEASGLTLEAAQSGPGWLYAFSFGTAIIFGLALNWLNQRLGARTFADGAKYAFFITITITFLTMMNENNYLMRPMILGIINGLYPVLSISIMGGIIAAMRKSEASAPQARTQS